MKIKIASFIFAILLTSCGELGIWLHDMYLSRIEICNALYDDKSTIYFECDILGDSIIEIPYLERCIVPINQLWKNTNYADNKTVKRIHDKIIGKHNFKIYRYKNGEKQYFSFEKLLLGKPNNVCTWEKNIDDVSYVFYPVFTEEEFWE